MMSKGKRSLQLKPGPAPPVLALATKTKSTEHVSLKKNCLRLFGYHHGSQKNRKTSWPIFEQRIQEFESQLSKPNLLLPTLDSALSKLERGFNKSDTNST
eukprot:889224-Pelagomonas_calceolata.AAC.1